MNKLNKLAIVGAALAAVFGPVQSQAAYSGGVSFQNQDLVLNLREVNGGAKGAVNVTIDLGNLASFKASNVGHGFVDLSSYLAGTDLVNLFGGNLNNVFWSVTAANVNALDANKYDLSVTRARSSSASDVDLPGSTAWNTKANNQSNPAAKMNSVGNNAFGTFGTALGTYGATVATGANGYDGLAGTTASGATANWGSTTVFPNPGTEIATGASFASPVRGDFYDMDAQAATGTPSTYVGFFQFGPDASFGFYSTATVVAVPEPATYGALAGLGMLALSFRRSLRK